MAERTDYIHIMGPAYIPYNTYPAGHILSGVLNEAGYSSKIIYSNIEALDYIIGKSPEGKKALAQMKKPLTSLRDFKKFVSAKRQIRSELENESAQSQEFLSYIHNYLTYQSKYPSDTIAGLAAAAHDPKSSIFYNYIREKLIPRLIEEQPRLIGLTITDRNQASFAMALAGMIKGEYAEQFPSTKIAIGGYLPSVNRESFFSGKAEVASFFKSIDFVSHNQGENAIVPLMEHVEGRREAKDVPKLIYMDNGEVKGTSLDENGRIDPIKFTPAESGFYFSYPAEVSEKLHLPADSSEMSALVNFGCNYLCSFCGTDKTYDAKAAFIDAEKRAAKGEISRPPPASVKGHSMDEVLDSIALQARKNKVKVINFSDERLSPQQLLAISMGFQKRHLKVKWSAYATLDRQFLDTEFVKKLRKGGCSFLQFGVETITADALLETNKRQNIRALDYQTKAFATLFSAGIMPHVFLMLRLPRQRSVDLAGTLAYLKANGSNMLTIKPTIYHVTRSSMDAIYPEKAGLRLNSRQKDFSANFGFESLDGRMSAKLAGEWRGLFDKWIALYHPYNAVTRELGISQRLAADGKIINWAEEISRMRKKGSFRLLDMNTGRNGQGGSHTSEIISLLSSLGKASVACLEESLRALKTPELGAADSYERKEAIALFMACAKAAGSLNHSQNILKKYCQSEKERSELLRLSNEKYALFAGNNASSVESAVGISFELMQAAGALMLQCQSLSHLCITEKAEYPQPLFTRIFNSNKAVAAAALAAFTLAYSSWAEFGNQLQAKEKKELVKQISSEMDCRNGTIRDEHGSWISSSPMQMTPEERARWYDAIYATLDYIDEKPKTSYPMDYFANPNDLSIAQLKKAIKFLEIDRMGDKMRQELKRDDPYLFAEYQKMVECRKEILEAKLESVKEHMKRDIAARIIDYPPDMGMRFKYISGGKDINELSFDELSQAQKFVWIGVDSWEQKDLYEGTDPVYVEYRACITWKGKMSEQQRKEDEKKVSDMAWGVLVKLQKQDAQKSPCIQGFNFGDSTQNFASNESKKDMQERTRLSLTQNNSLVSTKLKQANSSYLMNKKLKLYS